MVKSFVRYFFDTFKSRRVSDTQIHLETAKTAIFRHFWHIEMLTATADSSRRIIEQLFQMY
jgi:hypothetical protein